jgi:hypothetical protein
MVPYGGKAVTVIMMKTEKEVFLFKLDNFISAMP